QTKVRARAYFGNEAERDVGSLARSPRRAFDHLNLENGINVDGVDSGAHGFIQLFISFARAVEDNLIRTKSSAQSFVKLAAAVYLAINPCVAHRSEHGHVRVGLRCVEESDGPPDCARSAFQALDVCAYARLGEDEKRRAEFFDEFDGVRTAHRQATA